MEELDGQRGRDRISDWKRYERDLQGLCDFKVEEFHLLGYREATASQVWKCVQSMTKGQVGIHQWVANIVNLKAGQFMNYMTMNAYRGIFPEGEFDARKQS